MADVPAQFAPQVMPSQPGAPPVSTLAPAMPTPNYPNPSAGAFGAAVGRGAEELGAGLLQAAKFFNASAADDASNKYEEAVTKILYGDPNAKDANGNADTGYMGLKGRAALDKRAETVQKITDLLSQTRSGLHAPDSVLRFDSFSRRFRAITDAEIGRHADRESNAWQINVQGATAKNAIEKISRSDAVDDDFKHGMQDLINARVSQAQIAGGGPEMEKQAYELGRREAWVAKLNVMGTTNPGGALALAQQHREELGSQYDEMYHRLHAKAEDAAGDSLGADAYGSTAPSPPTPPPAPGSTSGGVQPGLTPTMAGVLQDANKDLGFNIPISSGRRSEEHNAKIGGARQSRHVTGEAIDIPIANMPEDQQRKMIEKFLSDPRVGGFEYVPGHHLHVDVRPGPKWAAGEDATSGTVGKNWPAWLTERVNQWRGNQAIVPVRANLAAADEALKLTPEEKNLYEHHLHELSTGGVRHEDRSVSTLMKQIIESDGRYYVIPTVWDNKILDGPSASERAIKEGLDKFPSYGSEKEAEDRYEKLHSFMDMDTQGPQQPAPAGSPGTPAAEAMRRRAAAIEKIAGRTDLSSTVKAKAMRVINELASADQLRIAADEKDKKDANDKAANEYVTAFASGQTIPPGIVGRIAKDPRLSWQTKEHLVEIAKKRGASDVEEAGMAYGPAFWKLYKDVTAPLGDPNRIADPNALLSHAGPGGDLTLAGVQKLQQVMAAGQRSVNDNMVHQAQVSMMTYAKSLLSFDGESAAPGFAGLRDPQGEKIFHSEFVPRFLAQYDEWVKAGKNPWEFLTKEKIEEIASPMRDRAKMARDKLMASGQAAVKPENEPLPPTPGGLNQDSWQTLMKAAPMRVSGTPMPMATWAKVLDYLRAHPDADTKNAFNAKYGDAGFSADEVLSSLSRPPVPADREAAPPGLTYTPGFPPQRTDTR